MDATPISFDTATPIDDVQPAAGGLQRKWEALHDAAAVVAGLAGESPASPSAAARSVPAALSGTPHWRQGLIAQGIEDIAAIMEPGLSALIAVHARGGDASAPARALWQEFTTARDALVALALPGD